MRQCGMDILTFLATIIGALAWPAAVVIVVMLLRRPLTELIPAITQLKYKEFEISFKKQLEEVEEKFESLPEGGPKAGPSPEISPEPLPKTHGELLERLTELSPTVAILESWRNVERTMDLYFKSKGIERPKSWQTIMGHLDYDPNFPPKLIAAYQELRLLRNRAAHDRGNQTAGDAKKFSELADRLTYALIEVSNA